LITYTTRLLTSSKSFELSWGAADDVHCMATSVLVQMSVVREARSAMEGLAEGFVTRASAFLAAQLNQAVEELALEAGRSTDSEWESERLAAHAACLGECSE
jgi:hypothetical protein